ncbi:MAG: hypothetical protein WC836_19360 [Desulfobacula sp.]
MKKIILYSRRYGFTLSVNEAVRRTRIPTPSVFPAFSPVFYHSSLFIIRTKIEYPSI